MVDFNQKLFSEFPPVTTGEWEAQIAADLKGQDYEQALTWQTYEGFKVNPFYRSENLAELKYLNFLPGEFPFIRGTKSANGWLIRQDIFVQNFKEANKKALDILCKGVNSLGFYFDCRTDVTSEKLSLLLNDIELDSCEVNFVCPCQKCNCVEVFTGYVDRGKWDNKLVSASSAVDPLGTITMKGKFEEGGEEAAFSRLTELVRKAQILPEFRVIGVNGKFFGNSGSSVVQQLAFSLAIGTEYLTRLTDTGMNIDEVARKIKFNFSISNNYFMEIAMLRAARWLWACIVKAYRPQNEDSAKMVVHCETGNYNKTLYDPYVNMLRTQTETMSAVLGGAGSVTVQAYDSVFQTPSEFSERIARNQQILLKEEAYFDKTVDPGGGSYYIETLTSSIAEAAWKLFLQVQDKGGYLAALREGFIQKEINKMVAERNMNLAFRNDHLLGTNSFPDFSEKLEEELDSSVFSPQDFTEPGAEVETLKFNRGAQVFERLRYKTDLYSGKNKRPVAFMLTMGNPAIRKTRALFACNFFAIAGFTVIDNNGYTTVEVGVKAAKEADADIVVVCSSDNEYITLVPEVAGMLGKEILVVAGNPACREELETKGIKNFIHVRSNMLVELGKYQELLGI